MALWGKTDTSESAPKFLSTDANANRNIDKDNAFFVDTTEAAVTSNRAKGLKTPGWNLYKEYGNGRKYVETLVPMKVDAATAGDVGITNDTATEDLTVADTILAITVQPANRSVVAPNTAAFTVTATATPTTTITYQWQIQQSNESGTTWTNVSSGTGGTTASYTTAGTAVTAGAGATNGDKYRVLVSAPTKTSQIITSSVATLTVTAS
jgi:hypothetical protein